jgi:hypothetical protein
MTWFENYGAPSGAISMTVATMVVASLRIRHNQRMAEQCHEMAKTITDGLKDAASQDLRESMRVDSGRWMREAHHWMRLSVVDMRITTLAGLALALAFLIAR